MKHLAIICAIALASCGMRTSTIAGKWALPGPHPDNVPAYVYIAIQPDSARIVAVDGHTVYIAKYYFSAENLLVPLPGNPNLWSIDKQGHHITLTDSAGNVAVYSRVPNEF